jgi:outer membrane protein
LRRTAPVGIALACLAGVCFSGSAYAQAKIGVIDVEQILTESKNGKVVVEALQKFQDERRQELLEKQKQIEELQTRLAESRLTLAEDRLSEMEKQLEDLTIDARRARDDAQRELQKRQQEQFGAIERQVMPIIEGVGKELGYTLIFNKFQSGLLYAEESVDLTALIIERFDAASGG